ncbi:InlB B-repeat-containing protein [Trichlorobacter lovleyi]|uniref:Bacterial repeat domain-containing protein n=1 Tax=Trichlorobacter lovleyi (strain ATCC BAA-1151 / DSM 17278 / SZ) TaxID=398767 RepID=B3E8D9_TRIL1|nr:hypothetical protein [Trichlorobacter lovleyi]ACD95176.1 hypothetical protein Glov_1457 [Trichlorobacter lovleyi SZ]
MSRALSRLFSILLLFAAISLTCASASYAVSAVTVTRNGNFSSGLTSWNLDPAIAYGWNPLSSGKVDLHPGYGYLGQVLYQNLNVTNVAGKTFSFSCALTKSYAPDGKTVAVYLEYIDASNNRQLLKLANPDNSTISDNTTVTGNAVIPAGAQKVVRLSIHKEGNGDFLIDDISLTAPVDVVVGAVPVITGLSASTGTFGTALTVSGTDLGSSGTLTLAGSSSGLAVTSWNSTSINATVQSSGRSGLIRAISGYVESDGLFPFQVTSSHLALMVIKPQQTAVKGEIAEFVVRGDFLNGFTSTGLTFSVTGPGGSASPFPGGTVQLTPASLKNSGGFSIRISTSGLTIGQTYSAEVRTTTTSGTVSAPFSLTITGVASIKFYTTDPGTGAKTYHTTLPTVTKQGTVSVGIEAQDSTGQILTTPINISSSNPSILGVYPIYFYGSSIFALNSGSANLIADTLDGTSATLVVPISVPASPKVVNTALSPSSITNKDVTTKTINVGATLEFGTASYYGFGSEGMIITELGSMHYDSESKLFSGSLTVQQDTFDAEHPMPPNPGVVGVHVNLKDSSYSLLALQELPLTITNDPSYGLVKVAARSLDPASPGGEPWIALDFCDSSGTKLFSRYGQGDPTLDSNLTALGGISPASYKLKYMPPWGGSTPVWYPNAADAASAETVTVVAAGENQVLLHYLLPVTVSVTLAGTGSGSVASTPSGMTCSGDSCSGSYPAATWITLQATPADGSLFTGWSGTCSGTGSCTVQANSNASVTATFTAIQPTLTVTLSGSGSGSVTSSPSGISCPGTCAAQFDQNSTVTLAAAPSSSSSFTGWGGACSGTAGCSVPMGTSDKAVTAGFAAAPKTKVGILGFETLTLAYAGVTSDPVIKARDITFSENLNLNRSIAVTLRGGMDANFSPLVGAYTSLQGQLTVGSGSLTVENLIIK